MPPGATNFEITRVTWRLASKDLRFQGVDFSLGLVEGCLDCSACVLFLFQELANLVHLERQLLSLSCQLGELRVELGSRHALVSSLAPDGLTCTPAVEQWRCLFSTVSSFSNRALRSNCSVCT